MQKNDLLKPTSRLCRNMNCNVCGVLPWENMMLGLERVPVCKKKKVLTDILYSAEASSKTPNITSHLPHPACLSLLSSLLFFCCLMLFLRSLSLFHSNRNVYTALADLHECAISQAQIQTRVQKHIQTVFLVPDCLRPRQDLCLKSRWRSSGGSNAVLRCRRTWEEKAKRAGWAWVMTTTTTVRRLIY